MFRRINSLCVISSSEWCQLGRAKICLWSVAKRKRSFQISSFTYTLPTVINYGHISNWTDWVKNRLSEGTASYYHVPTKGVIEPKNQWIYFKNACCTQLTLCSETHKPHNCTEIHCELWFLSFMAFSVYKVVRARPLSVASLTNQLRNWQANRTTS